VRKKNKGRTNSSKGESPILHHGREKEKKKKGDQWGRSKEIADWIRTRLQRGNSVNLKGGDQSTKKRQDLPEGRDFSWEKGGERQDQASSISKIAIHQTQKKKPTRRVVDAHKRVENGGIEKEGWRNACSGLKKVIPQKGGCTPQKKNARARRNLGPER